MEQEVKVADTSHPIDDSTFDTQDFFKKNLVRTENGKTEIHGKDLSPMEMALLDIEVRRRGSQASSSREKARADRSELELTKVKENVRGMDRSEVIDPALKYSDPDEYIKQTLAAQAIDPYQDVFDTSSKQARQEAGQATMDSVIAAHNEANPNRQITSDMLEMDLPPRLMNEFTGGNLSPQDFLSQAADLMYRPTEIKQETTPSMPDLGEVPGQTTPTDDGSNDKMLENYSQAVF